MVMEIGGDAGKIWHYLAKHGQSSFANVVKGTKLNQKDAHRAIGWLAREGKIAIQKKKNFEYIALNEE